MLEAQDREAPAQYDPRPWIVGFAIGGALTAAMLALATGGRF